jgi:SsrA-binding protein
MEDDRKVLARNRKALHEYKVLSSLEVGIALVGSEIKSMRDGKVSLTGSFASFSGSGELYVHGMHIAEYPQARDNHDPYRNRKLLAHKSQLNRMRRTVSEKGNTLIPLDVHLTRGKAKLELGICRGKKQYDQREDIAQKDADMDIRREMKRRNRSDD